MTGNQMLTSYIFSELEKKHPSVNYFSRKLFCDTTGIDLPYSEVVQKLKLYNTQYESSM